MTEWLGRFFEFIKLPVKYMFATAMGAGCLLFLPDSLLARIGLDQLVASNRSIIGGIFLFASIVLAVELVIFIGQFISSWWDRRSFAATIAERIARLDEHEKAVLREFVIQGKNTLQLPANQETVAGLISKNFLVIDSHYGERSLAGILTILKINEQVRASLTWRDIGLPEERNEESIEWVKNNRPSFMHEIEHHNRIFHRTW